MMLRGKFGWPMAKLDAESLVHACAQGICKMRQMGNANVPPPSQPLAASTMRDFVRGHLISLNTQAVGGCPRHSGSGGALHYTYITMTMMLMMLPRGEWCY